MRKVDKQRQEKEANFTFDMINALIHYDHTTGKLYWKIRQYPPKADNVVRGRIHSFNKCFAGREAGSLKKHGYIDINIGKYKFMAARVAWLLYYGKWPLKHIDHIDRDRTNNRINNLRDISLPENNKNRTCSPRSA